MRIREVCVKLIRSQIPMGEGQKFRDSRQVFEAFRDMFLEPVEVFRVLLLDPKNRLLHFENVSRGSLSTSVVHPREVLWTAVYYRAAGIICLHHHPSGDPSPSREDQECTERIYRAGKILGIRLLDHIVIGESEYFSFADAGLLNGGEA